MPCIHVRLSEFVTDGEALAATRVHEFLAAREERWFLLTNGVLSLGRRHREIDQIIVGPTGVFVVDVKSFGGKVRAEGDRWILAGGTTRRDPVGEVEHLAGQLKGRLTDFSASLARIWVEGRVLLTADTIDVSKVPGSAEKCFTLADLERLIAPPKHVDSRLAPSLAEQVVRALDSAAYLRARQSWKTIGEYALVEQLDQPETPNRRSFRATDRHGAPAIVRLYDLSGVPAKQRARAEAQARSEFEALDAAHRANIPGIVRIRTPFEPVPDAGDELYYFALEQPTGATLADRLADPEWPATERLTTILALCRLLARIHSTPIPGRPDDTLVHRRLHPAAVFLGASPGDFTLTGFDVARATADTAYLDAPPFPLTAYDAPELVEGLCRASTVSDIYSLGVLLYETFSGRVPFGPEPRVQDEAGKDRPLPPLSEAEVPFGDPDELWALLDMMTAVDPGSRPETLKDIIELLEEMHPTDAEPEGDSTTSARRLHPLSPGQLLATGMRVVRLVGRGSAAWTYLVVEESSGREWVAKVLREPTAQGLERIGREFGVLRLLNHPAIVQVVEVSCRENAHYHLLMEHCRGRAFTEVFDELPALADSQGTTPEALVLSWAYTLLDALEVMHQQGVLHRDLAPGNLVLTDDGPKIIDFGLAWDANIDRKPQAALGTFPYRPPECATGAKWTESADLYGLAVILAQLLLGRLPFEDEDGIRQERLREELFPEGSRVLAVLRKALDPNPRARFENARLFRQALEDAGRDEQPEETETIAEESAPAPTAPTGWNETPYLDEVLKVYPASALGAAETRGLDTPFARETYVRTRLDREVKRDIEDGKLHLVLLSGNPGDGKTAYLQQLAGELGVEPDAIRGKREWKATLDSGLVVQANLDGSAAIGSRSSDEVLDEFLSPFFNGPPRGRVHLLAVNDGRLLEWLERYEQDDRWLFANLRALLDDDPETVPDPELTLIDLNDRCLVGDAAAEEETSVAERVLLSLLEGTPDGTQREDDPWAPCQTCRAASGCPVKFSVDTLRSASGATVRQRMLLLLQAVHLQGKVHVTMRQLRGALSYWFFGDAPCREIHRRLQEAAGGAEDDEESPADKRDLQTSFYFNHLFENDTPLSPLLEELVALDPAGVDNPGLDRRLYRLGPAEAAKSLLAFPGRADVAAAAHRSPTETAPDGDEPPSPADAWFASLRRQVFFEAPADFLRHFGLASPAEMTPFPALPRFLDLVSGHAEKEPVRDRLTAALSRADRVPEAVIEKHQLGIRTHGEAPVATTFFRSLPVEDFDIEIHLPRSLYVEHLPNRVHLRYRPAAGADLELSLELYQLVEKLYSGYRLGATELDALFGNLDVFRQRLLRLPTDRITAHHPAHGLHTIRTELRDGVRRLILEKEGE